MERRLRLAVEIVDLDKRREDWLDGIAREMIKVHELFPIKFLPEGDCPSWVKRVSAEMGRVLLPSAKVKEGVELTPKRVGGLLGHECAFAVAMVEWFHGQNSVANKPSCNEEVRQCIVIIRAFSKWYDALRKLAKRALCSAVDQTYQDMTDFLVTYSDAFARKPKSLKPGALGSTSFEIYVLFIMYWRTVQQMKSVSELHTFLRRILGEYRTGDLKRIEKICQRIDLHFRKPGRPKGKNNSDA